MEFDEADYLQISGIQHFKFCRRQWALIHIENQWEENYRTTDGEIFHDNVHDAGARESRGNVIITHDMRIFSRTMGLSGACDVLELRKSENGVSFNGMDGLYDVYPIEYKRGKPREDASNSLQLCAQAMCLEEMLCCDIPKGALFFGETRRRKEIIFTKELREEVKQLVEEMHSYFKRGYTPKVRPTKSCNACSLKDICLPALMRKKSVSSYVKSMLEDI